MAPAGATRTRTPQSPTARKAQSTAVPPRKVPARPIDAALLAARPRAAAAARAAPPARRPPPRREVVAADDGQRLAQLRAHQRRRAEHQPRQQLADLVLQWGKEGSGAAGGAGSREGVLAKRSRCPAGGRGAARRDGRRPRHASSSCICHASGQLRCHQVGARRHVDAPAASPFQDLGSATSPPPGPPRLAPACTHATPRAVSHARPRGRASLHLERAPCCQHATVQGAGEYPFAARRLGFTDALLMDGCPSLPGSPLDHVARRQPPLPPAPAQRTQRYLTRFLKLTPAASRTSRPSASPAATTCASGVGAFERGARRARSGSASARVRAACGAAHTELGARHSAAQPSVAINPYLQNGYAIAWLLRDGLELLLSLLDHILLSARSRVSA